ncbi:MAG: YdcF family protein, partial [Limisphaerales bacterium]
MVLGVVWLIWRRKWRSAVWLGVPAIPIFLIGSTPLVNAIVARAERPQALGGINRLAEADVVVALGGGYYLSENDLFGFSVTDGGSRVLTALELVRRGKAKALVLGGSVPLAGKPGVVATSLVQDWILASGVTTVAVTNLGLCANTHDEALRFKELSTQRGWRKVILVTSALHVPRA